MFSDQVDAVISRLCPLFSQQADDILDLRNCVRLRVRPGLCESSLYYERLLEFLDHVATEQLLKPAFRSMIIVAADAQTLLAGLENYRAPSVPKWIEPSNS